MLNSLTTMVTLKLLGKPYIDTPHGRLEPPASKLLALLYYLAHLGEWVSRDTLTLLFWPDDEPKPARAKLRQLISRSRKLTYAATLEVEPSRLRWQVDSDVRAFKVAHEQQNWSGAVSCYEGFFLHTFTLRDAPGFEAWLELERSDLHLSWREAALRAAQDLAKTDRHADASALLRRVWQLSDYDEEALQAYMRSAYSSGHKKAALQVFEVFQKQLTAEFGVEPTEASLSLATAIKQDAVVSVKAATVPKRLPAPNLPDLIGRRQELSELGELIRKEARFIALTGLGGVGKTRLALAFSEQHGLDFKHGTYFVPLAGVTNPKNIISSIAAALSFSFYGTRTQQEQLEDYLREKELLLVADNLEHLLSGSAVLVDLLASAPRLRVLATSREKPDLPGVFSYRLTGLPYGESSDAEALFTERAKAQQVGFEENLNRTDVSHLCELVEGLPLALELAAAWVNDFSVREIAQEISSSLDFLDRDTKGAHKRMRAVFEHSWHLLSPEQQTLLTKLSVFRGGFDKEAARVVTGATPYLLLSLTNRSLLTKEEGGRFNLHELIRQYAAEKLTHDTVYEAHSQYYGALLSAHTLKTKHQQENLVALRQNRDNLTVAWRRTDQKDPELIEGFALYHRIQGLFVEAEAVFEDAAHLARLEKDDAQFYLLEVWQAVFSQHLGHNKQVKAKLEPILANVDNPSTKALALLTLGAAQTYLDDAGLAKTYLEEALALFQAQQAPFFEAQAHDTLGNLYYIQGELPAAKNQYEQARVIRQRLREPHGLAQTLTNLGVIEDRTGDRKLARSFHEESLSIKRTLGDKEGIAVSLLNLGTLEFLASQFDEAESYSQESLALFKETGNRERAAAVLNNLAAITAMRGDYEEAGRRFEALLELRQNLGDKSGVGRVYYNLGLIQKNLGDSHAAKELHQQSLAIYEEMNNTAGMITALGGVGYACKDLGELAEAWRALCKAFELALATEASPRALDILQGVAQVLYQQGDLERAYKYAHYITENSASLAISVKNAGTLKETLSEKIKDHLRLEKEADDLTLELIWATLS